MARLSWSGIKAEAILELRNRDDISSRVENWLREAAQEVAYAFRFYELEETVTFNLAKGAEEITFSAIGVANVKHILSLRDTTNGRRIKPASFRFIDRGTISSGTPGYYCRFGSSLLFDAKPATTHVGYKLRYRKQIDEPNFSSGSSYPNTPSEWDEIIRLLAVAKGYSALFEKDMADEKEARALRLISRLPTDEFVDAEDSDFGITVRV